MIEMQNRILPLSPAFPRTDAEALYLRMYCHSALECRAPLSVAFCVTKGHVERIKKDSEELVKSPVPRKRNSNTPKHPGHQDSSRNNLQLSETLGEDAMTYSAAFCIVRTESNTIVVKFSSKYSKEPHEFCSSRSNHPPKLLALQELRGLWIDSFREPT